MSTEENKQVALSFFETGVTAEGDKVAVEMDASGVSATGKQYQNEYHDLLEIRGGLYPDSNHGSHYQYHERFVEQTLHFLNGV